MCEHPTNARQATFRSGVSQAPSAATQKRACVPVISLGESYPMPRKLPENAADTMCHIFCGWRQWSSKNRLMELGSSTLESDILTAECIFDDERIAKLPIATELQLSLQQLFYSPTVYTVP